MGRILVDRDTIDEMKKGLFISRGKEGQCYFLDENNVVKIFYYYDRYRNIDFDNRYHEQISYPKDILIDKESKMITGYTMPYLKGQKFEYGFPKYMTLEELKNAYLDMKEIILEQDDIYMDDNCLENMLYDFKQQRINLIDTSRWYTEANGQVRSLCDFNFFMTHALLKAYQYYNSKIKNNNRMQELYEIYYNYWYYQNVENRRKALYETVLPITNLFSEFLEEIETSVSEYKGEKVKTINDITIL